MTDAVASPATSPPSPVPLSRHARPGDLVFFVSGGHAYYNEIYADGGMMYGSPGTGETVQKREIWSAAVVFGRVMS